MSQAEVKRGWQGFKLAGVAVLLACLAACTGMRTAAPQEPVPSQPQVPVPAQTEPILAAPPAGITYRTGAGTFVTQGEGGLLQVGAAGGEAGGEAGRLSPDGHYRLENTADMQTVSDLRIDETWAVWPRQGLNLCRFDWAPGQPSLLVSMLLPEGADAAFSCNLGAPVLLSPDGEQIEVLDESASGISGMSFAPDGQRFAYDVAGKPYVYTFGAGAQPLDLEAYAAGGLVGAQLADPAWSPSGRLLAWTFRGASGEPAQGVVVLDLQMHSATVLGPYAVEAYGATRPRLAFSPDERYLALRAYDTSLGDFASSILSVDGSVQRLLEGYFGQWAPVGDRFTLERKPGAQGCRLGVESADGGFVIEICLGDWLVWSPDGAQVLSHPYNREAFWVTDLASQETVQVAIPAGVEILGWGE